MIRLLSLVDNVSENPDLKSAHGLSIYIETSNHKILFDLGPDESYEANAKKLGVDLKAVDTVIISHGHNDHGGALKHFRTLNPNAKIYIKPEAFLDYYAKPKFLTPAHYIGLDAQMASVENLIFTKDEYRIDDELLLFSGITEKTLAVKTNDTLFQKVNGKLKHDEFQHEQYLVITDGSHQVLLTGCSHKGIVNILRKFSEKYETDPNATVIGGFHLYNPGKGIYESTSKILKISDVLLKTDCRFYTCHCTGEKAYAWMKERMTNRLNYFGVSDTIEINKPC